MAIKSSLRNPVFKMAIFGLDRQTAFTILVLHCEFGECTSKAGNQNARNTINVRPESSFKAGTISVDILVAR
jgi:hypothetical protein